MDILSFRLFNTTSKEVDLLDYYCNFLLDVFQTDMAKSNLSLKIDRRIDYMYTLPWIQWIKYDTNSSYIISLIYDSLYFDIKRNNNVTISINNKHIFKNTYTPAQSIIKFLNSGDNNVEGIGFIDLLKTKYNTRYLQNMWNMCVLNVLGYIPESTIYRI